MGADVRPLRFGRLTIRVEGAEMEHPGMGAITIPAELAGYVRAIVTVPGVALVEKRRDRTGEVVWWCLRDRSAGCAHSVIARRWLRDMELD